MNADLCKHERFHFGSGGYYIFCSGCNFTWVASAAEKGRDDALDQDRGSKMGHTNEGLVREPLLQLVREQKNRQAELYHKVVLKREEFEKLSEGLTLENKSMMDCGQPECNRELLPPGCLTHLNAQVGQLQEELTAAWGLLQLTAAEIIVLAGALSAEGQANLGADAVRLLRKFDKALLMLPQSRQSRLERAKVEAALIHGIALGHAILDPASKCSDCLQARRVFLELSKEWKHGPVFQMRQKIEALTTKETAPDA